MERVKHGHRSRSEKERKHDEKKRHKRSLSPSDSGSESSSSSSPPKKHKHSKKSKHKNRSRSRERRSRSKEQKHKSSGHRSDNHDRPRTVVPKTPEELERMKEEHRKQKELLKAIETPEEKRARRLAKKELKEKKRKEQMGWDEEYMGYTNDDNPFGDERLLETFVWHKKMEKEGKDLKTVDIEKLTKQKMEESRKELEKVKKRRLERERESDEREREREQLQRQKELEYYRSWEGQEDNFHLNQAKLRSKIRIEDGRAKPIDLLARYVSAEDDDLAVEMHEPYLYLNGLTITDLEDLLEDIKVYVELEQEKNVDYWKDITIVTEDELNGLRKIDPLNKDYVGDRREGINQSVGEDVVGVFRGKSLTQLVLLENQIKTKLKGGEGVDVGYWESLLEQLKAHMARQRLRERHQDVLKRKLFKLKQEQGIASEPIFPIIKSEPEEVVEPESRHSTTPPPVASQSVPDDEHDLMPPPPLPPPPQDTEPQPGTSHEGEPEEGDAPLLTEEDLEEQSHEDYTAGSYSPRMLRSSELEPDTIVYNPEDDIRRLEYARRQVTKIGVAKEDSDRELVKKAREGMTDDEAQFSVEVPIEQQALLWSDKYRPRKPRFFNRVHTGFEWNKYNQTHYDLDNPPPKIVQGYKFNIFYPDLIDKANTPEYTLTPIENNSDFATLRFHAGPPYEDIAFKIVNREWEYSYKRGFRCQFHNNIFQLWFHFKRYRYRR